ncbi:MAG: class I SAM-dependent methyltransferase [Lachnospiraceae bacterium]|nr:class I SAM-dependent methyltransferase [Lachnospiraceae bacterium]
MAKTEKLTKTITLSARMQALADMVTEGNRVCDLGCDHGFLSIYLVQRQISPGVLAMDVGKGPLMRAEEHVRKRSFKIT